MDFLKVEVYTKSQAVDILVMRLSELGINGFEIHDSADFDEFLENKDANWDYVDDELMGLRTVPTHITLYLQNNAQGLETLAELKGVMQELYREAPDLYGEPDIHIGNVREEDWANNWKQYFKPFPVGEKLYIKPSWETIPEQNNRTVLEIDPASSFGTGQHHTTRLCLELSESVLKPHDRILDLGCGSGILSIGAMLLGADSAVAVDIVDNSVRTALENAGKNHISPEVYHTYCGDICSDTALRETIGTGYDLIYANIVADVLIAMSGLFGSFLKPEGSLIVSGIIIERADEVLNELEAKGFEKINVREKEGWAAALLRWKK